MIAPKPISDKVRNALRFVKSRPMLFLPPNVSDALEKVASNLALTAEEAASVVDWYQKGPYDFPRDIFKQLVGKDAGLAWFKSLAKKAAPLLKKQKVAPGVKEIIEKRVIHESVGVAGKNGWTPTFTSQQIGDDIYIYVGWVGGSGTPPIAGYVGPSGITTNIMEATSFATGGGGGSSERVQKDIDSDYTVLPTDQILVVTTGCTITLLPSEQMLSYLTIKSDTDDQIIVNAAPGEFIDGEEGLIINVRYYSIDLYKRPDGYMVL